VVAMDQSMLKEQARSDLVLDLLLSGEVVVDSVDLPYAWLTGCVRNAKPEPTGKFSHQLRYQGRLPRPTRTTKNKDGWRFLRVRTGIFRTGSQGHSTFVEVKHKWSYIKLIYLNKLRYMACSRVYIRASVWNPNKSPLRKRFPASQLSGLSAFGASINATIARQTVPIPQAGDQSDFSTSRHISPVLKSTFGWKIGVTKMTVGGEIG
jgi:hypothetical protein